MDAEQYQAISQRIRRNESALRAFLELNRILKYLCYALYPTLLIFVAFCEPRLLWKEILVPAVLFVLVSAFRRLYNEPRPYEVLDIDPLIRKSTMGKSMPSRHIFSVFMIAMAWLAFVPWVGVALIMVGIVMGVLRVVGGVHFPRDVIVGAAVAIIGGYVGFWCIPMTWFPW